VLVHGSGSSSFMWAPIQRELALLGRRSLAVDLPGHGFDSQYSAAYQAAQDLDAWAAEPSTLAGITLQDNVDMVVDVARRVAEHGPVVLVGAEAEHDGEAYHRPHHHGDGPDNRGWFSRRRSYRPYPPWLVAWRLWP
jgi:Alpha/beta hydrolase family